MEIKRTQFDTMRVVPVSKLKDQVKLPDFQRSRDIDHIVQIYKSLLQTLEKGDEPKLIGCLVIMVNSDGVHYLCDGNHRLKALLKLLDHGYDLNVYVQQLEVDNDCEIEKLFEYANNSLPIPNLPTGVKRSTVNKVVEYFYSKYGNPRVGIKIKPIFVANRSGSAQRPRICRTKFEYHIGNLIQNGENPDYIIEKLEDYNRELNRKHNLYFKRNTNDTNDKLTKMLKTADTFNCRLGMIFTDGDFGQLYKLFNKSDSEQIVRVKRKIPKSLKQKVWERYCGRENRISNCPFCQTEISCTNFHCAHNQAEANGGQTTIDNLFPCCAECNLSMGKKTYEEFISYWT